MRSVFVMNEIFFSRSLDARANVDGTESSSDEELGEAESDVV